MKRGSAESRLLDTAGIREQGAAAVAGDNTADRSQMTNEGTAGMWLQEEHALMLTKLEVGWLYGVLDSLDKQHGENWPTAKPGPNREPIPTTMPRRICDKLAEFWK